MQNLLNHIKHITLCSMHICIRGIFFCFVLFLFVWLLCFSFFFMKMFLIIAVTVFRREKSLSVQGWRGLLGQHCHWHSYWHCLHHLLCSLPHVWISSQVSANYSVNLFCLYSIQYQSIIYTNSRSIIVIVFLTVPFCEVSKEFIKSPDLPS